MRTATLLSAAALLATAANALIPIEIKGNRFIKPALNSSDDGEVFQVIGVDYQPDGASGYDGSSGSDVLTQEEACLRDAYVLQQLGINTIRIYAVNPWLNHDACMSIFNSVGIYVVLDVNSPLSGESIARDDPASTYNSNYLNRIFGIVDAFKGYPNLLGFFAGNEVVNDATSAGVSPPYMRAVTRDLKNYIALHANRTIPVGYSAADDTELREAMWKYLECGDDTSRADFYGLNSYQWCSGRDDWSSSGYGTLLSTFQNTSIPVFLSEYGCNVNSPRTFDEVYDGIYAELATVFSGGLVYEYSQESNDYGLVEIKDDDSVRLQQDFANLQTAYNKINMTTTMESDVVNGSFPTCNSALAKAIVAIDSSFNASFTLPACPDTDMLKNGGGNSNIGKIIDLSGTASNYSVYNVAGKEIANTSISISSDDQINTPAGSSIGDAGTNGNTDSSSSSSTESSSSTATSSSSSSSTSTSKGQAFVYDIPATGALASIFAIVAMFI